MPKTTTDPTILPAPDAPWTLDLHWGVPGVEMHLQAVGPKAEIGRQLVELGAKLQREAREHR